MNGLRLLELARPSVVIPQGSVVAATTAVKSTWFNMGYCEKLAILILAGINGTNSGGSAIVTMQQATTFNDTATTTKALNAILAADINQNSTADTFTRTTGLTGTLTLAPTGNNSVNHLQALVDIDPSLMDTNNAFNYAQVVITGGSVGCLATAIVFQKFSRISSSTAAPNILS